jgi:hypothetical protein
MSGSELNHGQIVVAACNDMDSTEYFSGRQIQKKEYNQGLLNNFLESLPEEAKTDSYWLLKYNQDKHSYEFIARFLVEWMHWAFHDAPVTKSLLEIKGSLVDIRRLMVTQYQFASHIEGYERIDELLTIECVKQKYDELQETMGGSTSLEKRDVFPMYLQDAKRMARCFPTSPAGIALRALVLLSVQEVNVSLDYW